MKMILTSLLITGSLTFGATLEDVVNKNLGIIENGNCTISISKYEDSGFDFLYDDHLLTLESHYPEDEWSIDEMNHTLSIRGQSSFSEEEIVLDFDQKSLRIVYSHIPGTALQCFFKRR